MAYSKSWKLVGPILSPLETGSHKQEVSFMNYQTLTPDLIQQLSAIAPGRVFTNGDINEDYTHDEMPIYGKAMPEAVVEAASTEEIAAVMKLCNEHCIPVTPRGAG